MSGPMSKRLLKEYQLSQRELGLATGSSRSTSANPDLLELRPWDVEGEDLTEWMAVIRGPVGGNYAGGTFELGIRIPPTYPTKPPSISFKTRLFHPNISWKDGEICLDVLQNQWTPAWTLSSACTAILALLDAPEPDSPLNVDAATLFRAGDVRAYASASRARTFSLTRSLRICSRGYSHDSDKYTHTSNGKDWKDPLVPLAYIVARGDLTSGNTHGDHNATSKAVTTSGPADLYAHGHRVAPSKLGVILALQPV